MSDATIVPIRQRPRSAGRLIQFIDYAFWLLYTLLVIRLILVFFDARSWTGFMQFIRTVTDPFAAPFRGIVSSPDVDGTGHTLAIPLIIAIVVYALLQFAIHKLLRVIAYRQTDL